MHACSTCYTCTSDKINYAAKVVIMDIDIDVIKQAMNEPKLEFTPTN